MSFVAAASEHQREMFKDLAQEKADASDLADLRSEVSRSLELKSDVVQVNEALGYKANIAAVNIALERIENQSSNVAIKVCSFAIGKSKNPLGWYLTCAMYALMYHDISRQVKKIHW